MILGKLGNNLRKIGFKALAKTCNNPEFSAIFIIPVHKTIKGIISKIRLKPLLACVRIPLLIVSISPVKKNKELKLKLKQPKLYLP